MDDLKRQFTVLICISRIISEVKNCLCLFLASWISSVLTCLFIFFAHFFFPTWALFLYEIRGIKVKMLRIFDHFLHCKDRGWNPHGVGACSGSLVKKVSARARVRMEIFRSGNLYPILSTALHTPTRQRRIAKFKTQNLMKECKPFIQRLHNN